MSKIDALPQTSRFAYLDVARGIAASAVVLQHSLEQHSPAVFRFGEEYFNLGIFGVVIFFLASGFIIPPSVKRNGIGAFWVARFFRLFPMYWLAIIFNILLLSGSVSLALVLANATMFQEYLGFPNIHPPFWTLSMEMAFYILCSAMFALSWLRKIDGRLLFLAAMCGFIALTIASLVLHRPIPLGRAHVIVASFVALSFSRIDWGSIIHARRQLVIFATILVGSLVFAAIVRFGLVVPLRNDLEPNFSPLCVILSWVGAYGLFFLLYSLQKKRFPTLLVRLGTICYSMYLVHPFLSQYVPAAWPPIVQGVVVWCATVAISSVTWKLVEKPMIGVGRKVVGKMVAARSQVQPD